MSSFIKIFLITIILILPLMQFTIFTIPQSFQVNNLDPQYTYDVPSINVMMEIYENLVQYDSNNQIVGMQADYPIISEDKTEYTFVLRKHKFSNGQVMNQNDVKYSFMRLLLIGNPRSPQWIIYNVLFGVNSYEELFYKVTKLQFKDCITKDNKFKAEYYLSFYKFYNYISNHFIIKDEYTITIKLDKPNSQFLQIIQHPNTWQSIVNKEWQIKNKQWDGKIQSSIKLHFQKKDATNLYYMCMGSNQYKIKSITNEYILFELNKYYINPPNITEFKLVIDKDSSHRLQMFKEGKYHIIMPYLDMINQYKSLPNIKIYSINLLENRGILLQWNVKKTEQLGSGKLDGNGVPSNVFSDIYMRKGFLSQFPFYMCNFLYWNGTEVQTPGAIPSGLKYFNQNLRILNNSDFNKQSIEYFKKQWNGEIWKKGFKFTIYYFNESKITKLILEQYKLVLHTINPKFNIIVKGLNWNQYEQKLFNNELLVIASGWIQDYASQYDFVYPYMSSNGIYGAELGDEYKNWQKEFVDPILEKILMTTNENLIQQYYNTLIGYNYDYQLGVYVQSDKYIVINNNYEYKHIPIYSGVYVKNVKNQKTHH